MLATIKYKNRNHKIDLTKPLDISIPLFSGEGNVTAWYVNAPKIEPVVEKGFIGKVSEGASINFNNISFNPHGHGTHTECVGHITNEFHSVNTSLHRFFFFAEVISVAPESPDEDFYISKNQLQLLLKNKKPEALVIRTLPNGKDKLTKQYSNTNWPYLQEEAATFLQQIGVKHLLIDLPSVDKEKDEGALLAHRAFWNTKETMRYDATITEMIFVPNTVKDGSYFLNIQIAPFVNDASPSKPVLYKILEK